MSTENKIIRLASIDAAATTLDLPKKFQEEKDILLKELQETKMLIIKDGKFSFIEPVNDTLYQESFRSF